MMSDTKSEPVFGEMEAIKPGDPVLIYLDEKRKYVTRAERGKITGTEFGFVKHDDIIGLPYGSVIKTSLGRDALLLKPLRQDYAQAAKRVTQIIYPKDAALMIYLSGLSPGWRVGEAGVGTGALTIALASFVGDSGRVYGFDISEKAIAIAESNLERAGLRHRAVLQLRDVREGVDVGEPLDSFFLDIPDPWNAIESVARALKPAGTLLIYVPTVNQVEKTVLALRGRGDFCDIRALEVLVRDYEVKEGATRPRTRMIGHTGYVIFARKTLASSSPSSTGK